jgi:hypothetical protein
VGYITDTSGSPRDLIVYLQLDLVFRTDKARMLEFRARKLKLGAFVRL